MRAKLLSFCVVVLLATGVTHAQSNLVMFLSQPGDYIGQGQTYVTTNSANFNISGSPATFNIGAFGYNIYFSGPGGTNLDVGTYTNGARWPFNGNSPGISIFGNGRGCNTVCGSFQILELHTNDSGNVDRLWLTFTHICECFNAPMTGEIRFNSQLAPPAPLPRIIHVPADYPTIQSAVNAAGLLTTDTVLVSPGTYNESVNFSGHSVMVMSTSGPAVTTIKPPSNGTGVSMTSGETASAVLSGFTIANAGTGVSVSGSTPTITSNILVNCGTGLNCNFASPTIRYNQFLGGSGSALYLNGAASPLIDSNIIRTNHGGVIMFAAGSPTIQNNLIQGNIGDGMNMVNQSDANIIQNVIVGNTGNGIYWLVPSGARGPWVVNNTIAKNGSAGIYADGYDINAVIANNIILGAPALGVGTFNDNNPPAIRYNDIFGSGGPAYSGATSNLTGLFGNISADPLFTCVPSDDYHLLSVSPCIDIGSNSAPALLATDFDGNSRIRTGVSSATIDLGAFEFNPAFAPTPCLYVICPSNIVVAASPGQNYAIVNYPAPTGPPVATISSFPASGSVFFGGTNVVTCTASYGGNSVTNTFTITVMLPPTVTNTVANLSVPAGQQFSLSVTAGGSVPLTYRWTFENATINGATSSTLTVSNAQSVNEGAYRAVISNLAGSVTSSVTTVRVLPTVPTILTNPVSRVVGASSNATFSVLANGSQPLQYQWYFNSNAIPGATSAQFTLTNAQSSNAGNYYVLVSNGEGSTPSSNVSLTVTPVLPYFIVSPVGASLSAGSGRTLTGLANGSQPITYQWQRNSTNYPGAASTNLVLTNLLFSDSGPYTLVASNIAGVSTSSIAQLTISGTPLIVQPLSNVVVDVGGTVTLTVAANGSPTLGYTWQFNNVPIAGTNATLTITNIQLSQSGYYTVTVTNSSGSNPSTARVSVLATPSTVIAWGDNSGGQTNVPPNLNDVVSVSGGDYHSLALHHDGTLIAWGYNGDGQINVPSASPLRFVSIAAGANHNLGITEKGRVIAWGRNDFGQTNVPASATNNVLAIAAGDSHSIALLSSGTIVAWGDNSLGQLNIPQGLNGVSAISAGRNHNLALRTNGTVVAWGFNAYGQASVPANLTNVIAVSAGYLHSAALLANGTVVEWGDNSYGQTNMPPNLTNIVAISAGDFHTYALRADGTVVGWGDDTYQQTNVPLGLTNVMQLDSGNYHGLAMIPTPTLQGSVMNSSKVVLTWSAGGVLQWAPTPWGPFTDVICDGNSYTNTDMSAPQKYFRVRH